MAEVGFDSERIKKFFNGDYSEKDESYVNGIFNDRKSEDELKHFLSEQFDQLPPKDEADNNNLDNILYRIHYDINTQTQERDTRSFDNIIKWTFRIAGIIVLPLLIIFGIETYRETILTKESWAEIKAPAWTRVQFSLPDGTRGWLNSNSSLKYKGNFITTRQVNLTGEAFFDVFKDKKRPFVVKTNAVSLKVVGTRFNIASYDNEKNVEVVLEEGKLIFENVQKEKAYTMSPNELIVYDVTSRNFSIDTVQPQKYLSWTEGKLVFRNDPLDVIARRLERWYDIEVEVNVSLTEDLRLRATFIDEDLEEVLNLLKRSLPIDYKIENRNLGPNGIYVKKKVIITLRKV